MKKFVAGLLCGTVLSASTAVFASETIQAYLFPSRVKFHLNNTVKEVEGTEILNYKDKAYIPLRSFAEAMGATVTYDAASDSTGNLHHIEIYSSSDSIDNELSLRDPDGYVNIGNDLLKPVHNETIDKRNGDPIAILFGPPSNFNGDLSLGTINPFSLALYNSSEQNLTVKPVNIEFLVYKADSLYQPGELVYSFKLPAITGPISSKSGYQVKIPWNQRGLDGQLITPGKYLITIKAPDTVNYSVDGSNDLKAYHVDLRVKSFGVQFNSN